VAERQDRRRQLEMLAVAAGIAGLAQGQQEAPRRRPGQPGARRRLGDRLPPMARAEAADDVEPLPERLDLLGPLQRSLPLVRSANKAFILRTDS
jgi:hypothetical protein